MLKIAALLFVVIAPTLALMFVTAALAIPNVPLMTAIPAAFAAGAVVAVPFSWVVARKITAGRGGPAAA